MLLQVATARLQKEAEIWSEVAASMEDEVLRLRKRLLQLNEAIRVSGRNGRNALGG